MNLAFDVASVRFELYLRVSFLESFPLDVIQAQHTATIADSGGKRELCSCKASEISSPTTDENSD